MAAGRGTQDAAFVPNVASFYQTGSSQSLFSYSVNRDSNSDLWTFHLREVDTQQSLNPLERYPTLQRIEYYLTNNTLTGNCTSSADPGSSITSSTSCLSGTFLSFDLESNVPLNGTSTAGPSIASSLRTVDKEYFFTTDAPSLNLGTVAPSINTLRQTVFADGSNEEGELHAAEGVSCWWCRWR